MYQAYKIYSIPKKYRKKKIRISDADKNFSLYIRIRDIEYDVYCKCRTCGKYVHWKYDCDCGHFVPRNRHATRFNEQNCGAQCHTCNRFKDGEQFKHGQFIDKEFGEGTSKMLMDLGGIRGSKLSKLDEKHISNIYRAKAKELARKKGIKLS